MADTVSTTNELIMLAAFSDEDDRTLTIPNPKATITESDIAAINAAAANVLIGDKYGASFTRIKKATRRSTTRRKFEGF